jgi:hypothetical protein
MYNVSILATANRFRFVAGLVGDAARNVLHTREAWLSPRPGLTGGEAAGLYLDARRAEEAFTAALAAGTRREAARIEAQEAARREAARPYVALLSADDDGTEVRFVTGSFGSRPTGTIVTAGYTSRGYTTARGGATGVEVGAGEVMVVLDPGNEWFFARAVVGTPGAVRRSLAPSALAAVAARAVVA